MIFGNGPDGTAVRTVALTGSATPPDQWQNTPHADTTVYNIGLQWTKPMVITTPGGPLFKTQKMLGGRAIVSDSFSKPSLDTGIPEATRIGMGQYAHRDGYNVLYGDWSAKWYGDPQQRLMWWPYEFDGAYYAAWMGHGWYPLCMNMVREWVGVTDPANPVAGTDQSGSTSYIQSSSQRSATIWHMLDVANGMDIGDPIPYVP